MILTKIKTRRSWIKQSCVLYLDICVVNCYKNKGLRLWNKLYRNGTQAGALQLSQQISAIHKGFGIS